MPTWGEKTVKALQAFLVADRDMDSGREKENGGKKMAPQRPWRADTNNEADEIEQQLNLPVKGQPAPTLLMCLLV